MLNDVCVKVYGSVGYPYLHPQHWIFCSVEDWAIHVNCRRPVEKKKSTIFCSSNFPLVSSYMLMVFYLLFFDKFLLLSICLMLPGSGLVGRDIGYCRCSLSFCVENQLHLWTEFHLNTWMRFYSILSWSVLLETVAIDKIILPQFWNDKWLMFCRLCFAGSTKNWW